MHRVTWQSVIEQIKSKSYEVPNTFLQLHRTEALFEGQAGKISVRLGNVILQKMFNNDFLNEWKLEKAVSVF